MERMSIVEDDDDTRALYGFIMASAGFKVKAVKNGLEALAGVYGESAILSRPTADKSFIN